MQSHVISNATRHGDPFVESHYHKAQDDGVSFDVRHAHSDAASNHNHYGLGFRYDFDAGVYIGTRILYYEPEPPRMETVIDDDEAMRILGIDDPDDATEAYRKMVKVVHPDVNDPSLKATCEHLFRLIHKAYEELR